MAERGECQIRILAHVQIRIIRKFDSAQSPVNETDPEEKTITAFEISLQSTDDCFAVRARMNLFFFNRIYIIISFICAIREHPILSFGDSVFENV